MHRSGATGHGRSTRIRAHAALRSASAALVSLALPLLLGACGGAEKTHIDVTGSWESEIDQSLMSIEESGLFAMEIPGERLPIIGTVTIEGALVTFRNRPETNLCVADDGIYEVSIEDERLHATVVRDTCPSRVLHMSRPWRRVSADQSGVASAH